MSKPGQHKALDPVLFDFIPEGRGKNDAALYKVMRWSARKHRKAIYKETVNLWQDIMRYGLGYMKIEWDGDINT